MVHVIYCANLTYKFIYPILFGLTHYILTLLWTINDNISKDKIDKGAIPYGTHSFVNQWMMYLSESCVFICYYIKQFYFPINTFPQNKREKKTFILHHIKFFLILGSLDVLYTMLGFVIDDPNASSKVLYLNLCEIIHFFDFVFLCYLILHYKYYRHHILGCIIIIAGISLNTLFYDEYQLKVPWYSYILISIISNVIESLQKCLEKYLMDKFFYDPFMLVAGEGITGLIITSIILPIVYNITCTDNQYGLCMGEGKQVDDFIGAISYLYNNWKEMIIYICIFITLLFYNCFRVLTYQHLTPIHSNISRDLKVFMVFLSGFIPYFGNNKDNIGQSFKEIGTYIYRRFDLFRNYYSWLF